MTDDVSQAGYWEQLYQAKDTGWDKGRAAPPIVRMLAEGFLPKGARIAVVGAGPGHEAIEAARLGFRPLAVDFAPSSAARIRDVAQKAGVEVEVLQQDLFALPKTHAGAFDAVLEHTCFCAIDVARRAEYVDAVHALLKPGGIFFGLFYAHGKEGGPPFTTTEGEVRALFAGKFTVERLVRPADSFEARQGNELEALFRKS